MPPTKSQVILMLHSKLPWELESPCGFPYSGIYIVPKVRKDFPCYIAQIREMRMGECEESDANANLIITAVNVMPEVKRILRCVVHKKINGALRRRTFEGRCEHLPKKLEGVE